MPGPVVTLSESECAQAASIACARQISNRIRKIKDKYGMDPLKGWGEHIEGAGGEFSVAKYFGLFYNGSLGDFHAADVGRLQVRTTPLPTNRLTLHPDDKDNHPYILVTGLMPTYTLSGWLYGREGKKAEYWQDPSGKNRPAFYVPNTALHPIYELEEVIRKITTEESDNREWIASNE